jgi:alpha-N-acetylglucosaminidase
MFLNPGFRHAGNPDSYIYKRERKNMARNKFIMLFATFALFATNLTASPFVSIDGVKQLAKRQIGERANDIKFFPLKSKDGKDCYVIDAQNGKLNIKGSSPVAMAYGLHTYLQQACHSMQTWSGKQINIPEHFPDYKLTNESPYKYRYYLNVCTFGYTTAYWDWSRWEKEIDWMALHGINMPLAMVASEAIAERVWMKLGLSKNDIRNFFTSPAYLPWHRMGNLNAWDGKLSDSWQHDQIELQHLILKRMHELGMTPIAPAFAGFVPAAFANKHKDIKFKHLKWGGFEEQYNAYVLPPDSPYFEKIGKLFVQEWEKEFGKCSYYLSDSFNEMELPLDSNDKEGKYQLLAQYGESIYKSITAGDKNAVWVTQGWTFGYQHQFWDKPSLSALLSRVPNDKMLIVDLANDYPKWVWHTQQTWKNHKGYYDKQWIFSYVPNFGGKNLMTGDLNMYASLSAEALHNPDKGNLVGFGCAPEGIENNEVVYELLADMGWTTDSIALDKWLDNYCLNRYGKNDPSVRKAWKFLSQSVYNSLYSYPRFTWQTVIPDNRRVSKTDMDNAHFFSAVECFLSHADEMRQSQLYVNDAIELASYYASVKADRLYRSALRADSLNDFGQSKALLESSISILMKVDRLLASHPIYRLSEWVRTARDRGTTAQEKDFYEANAKRLITTWGGYQEDYAARFWSGLIKDYYIPRMKMYFSSQRGELDSWEEKWIKTPWHDTTIPYSDALKEAQNLVFMLKGL